MLFDYPSAIYTGKQNHDFLQQDGYGITIPFTG